jgi:potassium-transporting ATPase KdpC subunit
MKSLIYISLRLAFFFTIITGIVYPLTISGISRLFFREKAEGSLVVIDGVVRGSELIGQQFDSAYYFHSRPSSVNYETFPSGASNLSWSDNRLKEMVAMRKESFLKENSLPDTTEIPPEMLFASASGIDPHISPGAALLQVDRIAKSRNFSEVQKQKVSRLIRAMEENPQFFIFGEERINVFLLNLELDKIK